MTYHIEFSKDAAKAIRKLSPKLLRGVNEALQEISFSPTRGVNIKSLIGQPGVFRYRIGGWRIVYRVRESELIVLILDIGTRGDIYK